MSTTEVAKAANVHPDTVRKHAKDLDGKNLGGPRGYDFPDKAPQWLRDILHKKNTSK
jgi:hypothetical protein